MPERTGDRSPIGTTIDGYLRLKKYTTDGIPLVSFLSPENEAGLDIAMKQTLLDLQPNVISQQTKALLDRYSKLPVVSAFSLISQHSLSENISKTISDATVEEMEHIMENMQVGMGILLDLLAVSLRSGKRETFSSRNRFRTADGARVDGEFAYIECPAVGFTRTLSQRAFSVLSA